MSESSSKALDIRRVSEETVLSKWAARQIMADSAFQELLDEFLLEARERVDQVEDLLLGLAKASAAERKASIGQIKRELHTLKGNSGMMGLKDLQQLAHTMEDQIEELDPVEPDVDDLLAGLDAWRVGLDAVGSSAGSGESASGEDDGGQADGPSVHDPSAASVRVPFSRIDELVEMHGEALIFRNRLHDVVTRGLQLYPLQAGEVAEGAELPTDEGEEAKAEDLPGYHSRSHRLWEEVEQAFQQLDKTLNQLQEQVTEVGMVPLQSLFRTLGRIVHDESRREGKKVDFEILGGDTPIDKTLLEVAGEALGHLVRNAVIHGIEPPGDRLRAGKSETGALRVSAAIDAGEVSIEIADDGGGIDLAALEAARAAQGVTLGEGDSRFELIFMDGVSTRRDADIGAGRGVGMSAVKRSVERQGGRIEVQSKRGRGTSFRLRLPVTTSVMRSLLLRVDGEDYALPLISVAETQRLDVSLRHELNHAPIVRWRGQLVPLLDLGVTFGTSKTLREAGYVIVIEVNGRARGLAADDIVGIRDIVVKGLDVIVGHPIGIAGSTILGDGRVIMILDPTSLATIPPFLERSALSGAGRRDRREG